MDLFDTAVNVERMMKEMNDNFNEQHGIKRKEDQQGTSTLKSHTIGFLGTTIPTTMHMEASIQTIDPG